MSRPHSGQGRCSTQVQSLVSGTIVMAQTIPITLPPGAIWALSCGLWLSGILAMLAYFHQREAQQAQPSPVVRARGPLAARSQAYVPDHVLRGNASPSTVMMTNDLEARPPCSGSGL